MKTCMFLCFHVNVKHESTKTCMFPCNFSVYYNILLLPPLHLNANLPDLPQQPVKHKPASCQALSVQQTCK